MADDAAGGDVAAGTAAFLTSKPRTGGDPVRGLRHAATLRSASGRSRRSAWECCVWQPGQRSPAVSRVKPSVCPQQQTTRTRRGGVSPEPLSRVVDRVVRIGDAVARVEEVGAPRDAFQDVVGGCLSGQGGGIQDVGLIETQVAELAVQ